MRSSLEAKPESRAWHRRWHNSPSAQALAQYLTEIPSISKQCISMGSATPSPLHNGVCAGVLLKTQAAIPPCVSLCYWQGIAGTCCCNALCCALCSLGTGHWLSEGAGVVGEPHSHPTARGCSGVVGTWVFTWALCDCGLRWANYDKIKITVFRRACGVKSFQIQQQTCWFRSKS